MSAYSTGRCQKVTTIKLDSLYNFSFTSAAIWRLEASAREAKLLLIMVVLYTVYYSKTLLFKGISMK